MPLQSGSLIADKVRLVRMLGAGGMGQVWLADHLTLDTQVAVKLISAEHAANPEAVARFRREAAAAAKMRCPHAVQILDYGVFDDRPFIVMELLEGEDLAQRIQRAGPLPAAFVCDVVTQVCKALSRAHSQGIVHRDIKPENVFISEDHGERLIKVLDFGIAKRRGDDALNMTSTGVALGSPYYMSPEQVVSSKGVDPRSDLWSLGVVAYQSLTGRLPFVGETVGALAIAINDGEYPTPSSVRPGIPGAVDAWFERALVKDLEARFQNAKEMAEALVRAVGSGPGRNDFWEAETDVAPCAEAKPGCEDHCPTVRVSAPLLEVGARPASAEGAPVPALSGTHMTATLSDPQPRARAPVLWGVASGAALFCVLLVVGIALALGSAHGNATSTSLASDSQPAGGASALPVAAPDPPSPAVAPIISQTGPDPTPEASATPPAPKPPPTRLRAAGATNPVAAPTTKKKKDRGF